MIAFLTSSPCIPNADRALLNPVNEFVERMRAALPDHPQVLFVCSHPDSSELTDRFARDMYDAFGEAGMPFGSYTVLDSRTEARAAELVSGSDFIILAGGHVPTQNAYLQKINLRGLMRDYQGVVMGISAGSMNAARVVYAQPELEGESVDLNYQRWLAGLGLTQTMLLPHYQQVKDWMLDGKRLFEDITYADSVGHTFYAMVDGTYLHIADGVETMMGECYRIRDAEITQICKENHLLRMN